MDAVLGKLPRNDNPRVLVGFDNADDAGVYLIARLNWLFVMSPAALIVIASIGAFTAFVGATIGFAQNDIKKVLAYSTVSQLGYMMLAMGAGAFSAGMFHLTTHAMFKACLFLGSGSVIMAMHHEQDMRHMGGLKKHMPITFLTFVIATVAICGIFPLAGFFSKDEILWQVFHKGSFAGWYYFLWAMGFVGAAGTAFYMVRLVVMTFLGESRAVPSGHGAQQHVVPKESPWNVTLPLVVLASMSVVLGFLNIPYIMNHLFGSFSAGLFTEWLSPVIPVAEHGAGLEENGSHGSGLLEWGVMFLSVAAAAGAMYLSYVMYTRRMDVVQRFTTKFARLHNVVLNKYYVDEAYQRFVVDPLLGLNRLCAKFDAVVIDGIVNLVAKVTKLYSVVIGWCDDFFVDGLVNGLARLTNRMGARLRLIQTGHIQHYAYVVVAGIVVMLMVKILF